MLGLLRYSVVFGLTVAGLKSLSDGLLNGFTQDLLNGFIKIFLLTVLLAMPFWLYRERTKKPGQEFEKVIVLTILATVLYGLFHDQITLRVSLEYYTLGHVMLPGFPQNPTMLGLAWGFLATWWVGVIAGIPLSIMCIFGKWPPLQAKEICKPLALGLLGVECLSWLVAGIAWYLASIGQVHLPEYWQATLPAEKQAPFLADYVANTVSYYSVLPMLIILGIVIYRKRQAKR